MYYRIIICLFLNVKNPVFRVIFETNSTLESVARKIIYNLIIQKSYQDPITLEFQKRYAGVVLQLEKLNKDLNEYLVEVQQFCQQVYYLCVPPLIF